MTAILFWAALAVLAYTYLGYGLLAAALVRLRGPRETPHGFPEADWPTVTLVIPAYNEDAFIGAKLANTLALDYPEDKLEVVVVADGSTDRTFEIASRTPGVASFFRPERRGKVAAMNRMAAQARSSVLVFTDANAMLAPDALRQLVAPFADPAVGAVAGEKRVDAGASGTAGEGLYWRYESTLKRLDHQLGSVVGAAGELFALRTALYRPLEADTLLDDFMLSLRVAEAGYRVAYAPEAAATEGPSATLEDEWTRKVRICAGGWQSMVRLRGLLNPFRHGLLTLQYVSHRVLRWTAAPVLLPLVFALNVLLLPSGDLYAALLAGQLAFYAIAAMGWLLRDADVRVRGFRLPLYFVFMHAAVVPGVLRFLRGRQSVNWARAARAEVAL